MSQSVLERPGDPGQPTPPVATTQPTRQAAARTTVTLLVTRSVDRLQAFLVAYSLLILRVSLGLVFLGFGVIKFVPGLSPAEAIASATIDRLTFGSSPATPRCCSPP